MSLASRSSWAASEREARRHPGPSQSPRASGPDEEMMADSVTIEFTLYQIDEWTPEDKFSVVINGVTIDLGEMVQNSTSVPLGGDEQGITWQRQTSAQGADLGFGSGPDKTHLVNLTVPAALLLDEDDDEMLLTILFRADTPSGPIGALSAGVDDLVITAYYPCATPGPTAAPSTGSPTVTPGSPSASPTTGSPTTGSPTTGSPTTGSPTVTPGSPSASPTSAAPTTGAPTTGAPTTGSPTVTPGSPSGSPTTASPTTSSPTVTPGSPSAAPTVATPAPTMGCVPEVVIEDEDFQGAGSTVETEWTSGSTTDEPGFTEFLGRLGEGSEETSRTIPVPRASGPDEEMMADSVTIEFTLYQIDEWTPEDKFSVVINGVTIDLGEMVQNSTSVPLGGDEQGITWQRQTSAQGADLGFGSGPDKTHLVNLTVPAALLLDEDDDEMLLTILFRADTPSGPIGALSAGVDDLVITAYYPCATPGPTAAPSTGSPTVTPGSPSASPTTGSPTTGSPTTGSPTVTPGSPSASPTSAAPTTGAPTTGAPTTGSPTVTPGSPSGSPTTASPTTSSPTVTPGSPSAAPDGCHSSPHHGLCARGGD